MILRIRDLPDAEATRSGDGLLDHVGPLTAAPDGASDAARRTAALLPSLVSEARARQATYAASVATLAATAAQRDQKSAAAQAAETRAEVAFSSVRVQISLAIKAEAEGSPELDAYLFPDGVTPVIQLRSRAQLAKLQAWALLVAEPTATANPAYALIAALVQEFLARLATFAAALQEKEAQAVALTAARTARDQEREAWNETFTELIRVVGAVHGKDSDAFAGWIRPLLDIRAAQAAARTRKGGRDGDAPG